MKKIPPEIIVEAYSQGYFPMGREGSDTEIDWYSARLRGILPLDQFHLPRRVLRRIRAGSYEPRVNSAFVAVIDGCANRESTWINKTIRENFINLHNIGLAHSVEVWRDGNLTGGLYGLALGGAFFAESVYQSEPECMKMALHFCHRHLAAKGFLLWDVQFTNPFLMQFGCRQVSPKVYMQMLRDALAEPVSF